MGLVVCTIAWQADIAVARTVDLALEALASRYWLSKEHINAGSYFSGHHHFTCGIGGLQLLVRPNAKQTCMDFEHEARKILANHMCTNIETRVEQLPM